MGTDIHLAVEQQDDAGNWHRVLPPRPVLIEDEFYARSLNPIPLTEFYYAERLRPRDRNNVDDSWAKEAVFEKWYTDRSYTLFGILAGVRGDGAPIAQPRGLPKDLSPELHPDYHRWDNDSGESSRGFWLGDHTFSWLTVQELLDHNWHGARYYDFFVQHTLPALKALGKPEQTRIVFGFDS